ncbi:MAG: carotenoid biosynthesis protein [Carbonactinosporaceae bacterium]
MTFSERQARRAAARRRIPWSLAMLTVCALGAYPLAPEDLRPTLTFATVGTFFATSFVHAWAARGPTWALTFVALAVPGAFVVEVVGLHTGMPLGRYSYSDTLGAQALGVPVVMPFAWAMMAYPALLIGRLLVRREVALVAGFALAVWDVFLEPQMVAAGQRTWQDPGSALPGVPDVPWTSFAGWLVAATLLMAVLHKVLPRRAARDGDGVPAVLYLWTYLSSVLANLVLLGRPGLALVGGLAMGCVVVPYVYKLWEREW